eukprot:s3485_g14.t1
MCLDITRSARRALQAPTENAENENAKEQAKSPHATGAYQASKFVHLQVPLPLMARARTPLTAVLALVVAAVVIRRLSPDFVPPPQAATGAVVAAGLAAVSAPQPALAARASDEDDEGFDVRVLAVLALPLFAISWALFNVWRVAFRQVDWVQQRDEIVL